MLPAQVKTHYQLMNSDPDSPRDANVAGHECLRHIMERKGVIGKCTKRKSQANIASFQLENPLPIPLHNGRE